MFAPSMPIPGIGRRRVPGLAVKLAVVGLHFAAVVVFAIAGTYFLGLTIASPIVVPLAERQNVALSAMDLAIAQVVGSVWWLFAAGTIVTFGAALATIGSLMQRLAASSEE